MKISCGQMSSVNIYCTRVHYHVIIKSYKPKHNIIGHYSRVDINFNNLSRGEGRRHNGVVSP